MQQTNFLLLTRYSCAVRHLWYGCRLSSLRVFCHQKKLFAEIPLWKLSASKILAIYLREHFQN